MRKPDNGGAATGWRGALGPGLGGLGLLLLACGGPDPAIDAGPSPDAGAPMDAPVAVGVETVAPASLRAGEHLRASCLLVDARGERYEPDPEVPSFLRIVPEASVAAGEEGEPVVTRAGTLEVSCQVPDLRLQDDSPALVEVGPGDPAVVETRLDRSSIVAGQGVVATCAATDAFGNPVPDARPALRAEPDDPGTEIEGLGATFTRAGRYDVSCELPGALRRGVGLDVVPALPASLAVALVPDQARYGTGQVVGLNRVVSDRFGNRVDAASVPVRSSPGGTSVGNGRFRYLEDGRYALTATVEGPTEDDVELEAQVDILVDGRGPTLACTSPADGALVEQAPGAPLALEGAVADVSGVAELRVNGEVVPVDADGTFRTTVTPAFGINFVDLEATDGEGQGSSETCAFLVSDRWAPDSELAADTVTLALRQGALDDADRDGPIDSVADLLAAVLDAEGLEALLDEELTAANPLKDSCDINTFLGCLFRSRIDYLEADLQGPNTVDLELLDGGLAARVRLENVRLRLRVRGTLNTTGWVTFRSLDVAGAFDASLADGAPQAALRSVTVEVGPIATDFGGFSGFLIDNIVVPLAQGTLRGAVTDLVEGLMRDTLDELLDGLLSGLDIRTLGTSFPVPRLDGGPPIDLAFAVGFSRLTTSPERMLFGIGTRFSAPVAIGAPSLGVPLRSPVALREPDGEGTVHVAIDEALVNQALHALWRGGFLAGTVDAEELGLPAGVTATLSTSLPPVATVGDDGRLQVSLGALSVDLGADELLAEPVRVRLGARVSLAVTAAGDELAFDDVRVDELALAAPDASLDGDTREVLEGLLQRLLAGVVDGLLEGALPAIPIPSFALPADLADLGLPPGDLGIVSPTLTADAPHLVLRGDFGLR
ncbi:MAG: hypothetical protein ACFCGT_00190 [Sandaracinaceae bacterium]